jgi:WXG100 family type VII secretion target
MSFQVDLDQLEDAADGLATLETTVEQQLERLAETLGSLHRTWSGEAADAQRAAHARWTTGADEMHAALGRLRAAATHAHTGYTAAATANADMWRQTR